MAPRAIASSSTAARSTLDETQAIDQIQIVALLKLLHPQPLGSEPYKPNPAIRRKSGYELPFQRERQLAGILAFLSNTIYDNQRIPAIAVRETRKPSGLQVLVAVNRGNPTEGDQTIQKVVNDFERVFRPLAGMLYGRERDIKKERKIRSEVYDAILTMCKARIIERLDPGKMNKKTPPNERAPMKQRLRDAINILQEDDDIPIKLQDGAEQFIAMAKLAIDGIVAWENHQVMARMRALVDRFSDLNRIPEFDGIVSRIEGRSKRRVKGGIPLNGIAKIARYKNAATFLTSTAMKFPIAKQIAVIKVAPPPMSPRKFPAVDFTVHTALSQVVEHKKTRDKILTILRKRNKGPQKSVENLMQEFSECVKEIRGATTVHAEVQILAYCDQIGMKNPPRVVCSSKKACYLCNQLIQHRGTTFTPHAHNTLYPKWRLPSFSSGDITAQFTERLRNVAKQSVEEMLRTQKKILYPAPAESVCHTLIMSTTTLASGPSTTPEVEALHDSVVRAADAEELEEPRSQNLELQGSPVGHDLEEGAKLVTGSEQVDAELEDLIEPALQNDGSGHSQSGEDGPAVQLPPSTPRLEGEPCVSVLEDERNSIAASDSKSSCATPIIVVSAPTASSEEQLSSLSECEKRLTEAGARKLYRGNTIFCEDPGNKLDLVLDYPFKDGSMRKEERLWNINYNTKWLTPDEAREVRTDESISIFPADSLDSELTLPLSGSTERTIFLSEGESIVQLDLSNFGPGSGSGTSG